MLENKKKIAYFSLLSLFCIAFLSISSDFIVGFVFVCRLHFLFALFLIFHLRVFLSLPETLTRRRAFSFYTFSTNVFLSLCSCRLCCQRSTLFACLALLILSSFVFSQHLLNNKYLANDSLMS